MSISEEIDLEGLSFERCDGDECVSTVAASIAMRSQLGSASVDLNGSVGGGDGIENASTPTTTFKSFQEFYEPPYPDFTQLAVVHATFVGLYVLMIALSVLGNSLVCLTVFRNKKMHTAVNYYIVNLGICDLMVGLFVMPAKLLELAAPAHFQFHLNDTLCTVTMYFQTVFVFCSVLTLVATCVERYFAIVHPLESRMHHSKSRAKGILLSVWVAPCIAALPFLYPASAQVNSLYSDYGVVHRLTCFDGFGEHFRRVYFLLLFALVYVLPLVFIGGTCAAIFKVLLGGIPFHRQGSVRRQENNRQKVAKMVMMVAVTYAVSWTPYFTVTLVSQLQSDSFLHRGQYLFTMLSINLFAFANSCVNPFIYAAMSVRFRHGFRSIFLLMLCSARRDPDDERVHTKGDNPSRLSYTACKSRPRGPSSSSDTPPSSAVDQAVNGMTSPIVNHEQDFHQGTPTIDHRANQNHSSSNDKMNNNNNNNNNNNVITIWYRLVIRAARIQRNLMIAFRIHTKETSGICSESAKTKWTIAAPKRRPSSQPENPCATSLNLERLDSDGCDKCSPSAVSVGDQV